MWRCRTLSAQQRAALTAQALSFVDVRFGWGKMLAHLLDGLIGKVARRELFVFRQVDPPGRRPVCSEITALVYAKALDYRFGVEPECADPDHIHDSVLAHPGEWERVFCLDELPQHTAHRAA